MPIRSAFLHLFRLIIFMFVIIACGANTPRTSTPAVSEAVFASPTTPVVVTAPGLTITPRRVTDTATIAVDGAQVFLVSPEGSDRQLTGSLEAALQELAAGAGLDFEVRSTLALEELREGTRLVVVVAPYPGIASLAASAPEVQFVSVSIPGIEAGGNLSTLAAQGLPSDQAGFLAGYLAAMVTPEWRVGVLAPGDTQAGRSARQGFMNGVVFFCGLCRQTYPPYFTYPLFAELPATASPAEWQAAAQALIDQAVQTAYLVPGADSEELIAYLEKAGVELIGSDAPPRNLAGQWIASIQLDPVAAIRRAWPDLLAGQGGRELPVSLSVNYINDELLTPGRLRLLEETIANLESGYIDPGANTAGEGN
jgi:hypothetical protein